MASDILGQGWNISEKGLEIITESNKITDKSKILRNALDSDLKEIGSPVLAKILNKSNVSQVVLQIQKIRNISAPKANENSQAAPRMLKLVLTDGETYIQAIETASIPSLNRDKTPPGSKLLILSAKISSGYLLLDSKNCSLLGGKVPALFEKWELAKSVQYHNRQNASSDGPPAWVNFGCKIQSDVQDKQFKSLDNKNQEPKENSKFDLQRQDAIAEVTSGAVKKVFGGGVKQQVQSQPNPRYTKKPNDFQNKEKKNFKTKNVVTKEVDEKPQKPPERVSLFDFLEDKLPASESVSTTSSEPVKPASSLNRFDKNYQQNNKNQNRSYNTYQNQKKNYNRFESDQNNSYRGSRFQNNADGSFYQKPKQNYVEDNFFKPRNESQTQVFQGNTYQNSRPSFNKNDNNQNSSFKAKKESEEINGLSNNLEKMSLNSQFASRSLKQHLNLGPQKKNPVENVNDLKWKVGDDCLAKYWEDGKYYNANITAITEKTCVVKFKGYGNIEEVLKSDCLPVSGGDKKPHYTGPMEFRRNTRTYRRQ